ncbi:MAG: hypothetical protein NUV52_04120 [Candidatus Roizmanbacteria bacterium]|nr:hypothetical protein [Candidatus Roizmanbacteria bacterium]
MIYALYALLLSLLSLYSYALVDPNFTPINSVVWETFRNWIIPLGYYNRQLSFTLFSILILSLFGYQYLLLRKKNISVEKVALIVAVCSLVAYPFLSHDLFNYMFDAKILTWDHANPYTHSALDFPHDAWVRFMHWTHRTYPYGPTFLGITILPSYLSWGKFILDLLFFKMLWAGLYFFAIRYLSKHDARAALFVATSPLLIIEGLVNNHNDFIAVALGLLAVSMGVMHRNKIYSYLLMASSVLIKYTSLPFMLLLIPGQAAGYASIVLFAALIAYMKIMIGLQPWYFLNLYIAARLTSLWTPLSVLSVFLLFSYYPYVLFGEWNQSAIDQRDMTILLGMVFFVGLLLRSGLKENAFHFMKYFRPSHQVQQ